MINAQHIFLTPTSKEDLFSLREKFHAEDSILIQGSGTVCFQSNAPVPPSPPLFRTEEESGGNGPSVSGPGVSAEERGGAVQVGSWGRGTGAVMAPWQVPLTQAACLSVEIPCAQHGMGHGLRVKQMNRVLSS